ncbi:MAG: hypothetical protein QXM75_01245 [Candidatus Diapherotrites archaeon]
MEKIMYKATKDKLEEIGAKKIENEKSVLLPGKRKGAYDLFAEIGGKTVGIEILCRPTKKKLKAKLAYLPYVDNYVFVIPSNSLGLYRKSFAKVYKPVTRPKFFSSEFNNRNLSIWLCDIEKRKIIARARFNKIMNVLDKSLDKKSNIL